MADDKQERAEACTAMLMRHKQLAMTVDPRVTPHIEHDGRCRYGRSAGEVVVVVAWDGSIGAEEVCDMVRRLFCEVQP